MKILLFIYFCYVMYLRGLEHVECNKEFRVQFSDLYSFISVYVHLLCAHRLCSMYIMYAYRIITDNTIVVISYAMNQTSELNMYLTVQ